MKTWQLMLRIIRWNAGRFTLAAGSAVAVFSLPVAAGLVLRAFFDALSDGATDTVLWRVLAWVVAVEVGQVVAGGSLSFGWITTLQAGMALLRRNVLSEMVSSYGASHRLGESPGAALSRFRDDAEEIVEFLDAWIDLLGRVVFIAAALVVLLRIDAALTLAVLVPLVAIVAAVNVAGARVRRYRTAARQATSAVTGFLGEMLGASQAVQVASAAPHVLERFRRLNEARRRTSLVDATFSELIGAFYQNAASVSTGVLLLLIGRAMRSGTFTVGDFALFALYLPEVATFGDEIARWITGYRQAAVSIGRMAHLAPGQDPGALVAQGARFLDGSVTEETAPVAASSRLDSLQRLDVRDLVVVHGSGETAAGPISLTLERGTLTVVTGQIGAGKTALLEALVGLRPCSSGDIRWNGQLVDPARGDLAPPRTAFTPQVPRLLSATLRENVLLGTAPDPASLDEALRLAVMEPDVAQLEHGLDTVVGPRGVRLSGGQVQRAAAARMLAQRPDLLVVDDLSSALDVETEALLWDRLLAHPHRPAILAVSHRPAALERAAQVVVLAEGKMEAVYSP